MVRKLTSENYFKCFTSMTLVEQQAYLSEVRIWNERSAAMMLRRTGEQPSRFMTAIQCSVGWSDAECRAWEEGVRLMSAFAATDAMFQAAYTDSAKETIRWMVKKLRSIDNEQLTIDNAGSVPASPISPIEPIKAQFETYGPNSLMNQFEKRKRGRPRKQELPSITGGVGGGSAGGGTPVRPKHFDQYAHLLPEKTQERIAKYGPLKRELEDVRQKMSLLMNDQHSSDNDREAWAKRATAIDKELGAIGREADAEWDKLVKSGRVVVDDLGTARILNEELRTPKGSRAISENEVAMKNKEFAAAKEESQEPEMVNGECSDPNKRRALRKWLVDTRRGNGDTRKEHVKKWKENFAQYLSIEGKKAYEDKKILAAAKHYGIEFDKLEVKSEK